MNWRNDVSDAVPKTPRGRSPFSHIGSFSSIPSPEFSDSIDAAVISCQCVDNDANLNLDHHSCNRHSMDDNVDKRQTRHNGCAESCSMRSPKNVSINSTSRYFGNNQYMYKIRDSVRIT